MPDSNQTENPLFSLANRTVAITGGAQGLGITLALAVLEAGGHASCIDIQPAPSATEWSALQTLAHAKSLKISYHQCDITKEDELARVIDIIGAAAKAQNAPLRGAVACAGIQQTKPALEYPAEDFRRILDVNVTGCFLTAKHCARVFVEQKVSGSIILVASMSGQIANRVSKTISLCAENR
jgi:NAD(P)-dependent dehydrogenase (short-subunit alcohol dehydrogenase family)